MMNVLDLFSGIGGFSLGLERTGGFRTVAFCEIDPYCRKVLAKHWPDVPIYGDIRELDGARVMAHTKCLRQLQSQRGIGEEWRRISNSGRVDVICGGFPCQDISVAGKGAGLAGSRSGLWKEYARIIGELRPRYVIVENVSALLSRGLGDVLGDLAALGYDAEWHCIPASAVGAPHRRDRIWIVAYPVGKGLEGSPMLSGYIAGQLAAIERDGEIPDPGRYSSERCRPGQWTSGERDWWLTEPDVGRVAHGVPARVDRLKALGNAVVPQIPEIIGRAILAAEEIHSAK